MSQQGWNNKDISMLKGGRCQAKAKILKPFTGLIDASLSIGGSREGLLELHTPFQTSKIKESNKTLKKIGNNPLEKEQERKSCMFV